MPDSKYQICKKCQKTRIKMDSGGYYEDFESSEKCVHAYENNMNIMKTRDFSEYDNIDWRLKQSDWNKSYYYTVEEDGKIIETSPVIENQMDNMEFLHRISRGYQNEKIKLFKHSKSELIYIYDQKEETQ